MVKCALLIGLNYRGSGENELYGCINDCDNVKNFLTSKLGYTKFMVLTDDTVIKPTKANILKAFDIFVNSLKSGDEGWFHYSGHGILQRDFNNDEVSRYDSCIVPLDFKLFGNISDDTIRKNLTQKVRKGVKLYVVLDACNSGTGTDSRYKITDSSFYNDVNVKSSAKSYPITYIPTEWTLQQTVTEFKKYPKTLGEVYTISGCEDHQLSADAYIERSSMYGGALTTALLEVLNTNDLRTYKWKHLLKDISCTLKIEGYDQQPTITSGQPLNTETPVISVERKIKIKKEPSYPIHFFNNNFNKKNIKVNRINDRNRNANYSKLFI